MCPLWVPIHLSFTSQQGRSLSSLSGFNIVSSGGGGGGGGVLREIPRRWSVQGGITTGERTGGGGWWERGGGLAASLFWPRLSVDSSSTSVDLEARKLCTDRYGSQLQFPDRWWRCIKTGYSANTLYRKFKTNIPRNETVWPFFVSDLYIPTIGPHILLQKNRWNLL